ncbi:jg8788 [Pararge aegeria aegeria]|uniref:Jg8788 protein n=1 Tax=Pararge aegeria aegeria TaxID=348720 RepID=A0A8S4S2G2_9NEOP|nr:jg8788 [Pararge aegeria aegeria]
MTEVSQSLSDQIRNEEIRRRTRVTDSSTSREAEMAMGGAHSPRTNGRWGSKVLEWRPRTGKRSVVWPQRDGPMIKRPSTIDFRNPYKDIGISGSV